ncbi:MAG: hypothetical protein IJF92_00355 [Bacilli bacterium]|nr:hypothetical protein [Bacilli bacterium]MBQ3307561.1 hypothetical protein [Bacilli bacterium]
MQIETKYNVGDRVWIVYEQSIYTDHFQGPSGEVTVYSDTIIEISVGEDNKIRYMVNSEGADFIDEDNIILYNDTKALINRIQVLDNIIREREECK